ncbi:MAG: hypothetical protein E3K32_06835 [wastewater metagenome]|nr:hypothetical protein [Candidatus Loosdrechtia aerotolerans]
MFFLQGLKKGSLHRWYGGHIHILLSLNSTTPIAKTIQFIKGGSSKWIHDIIQAMNCLPVSVYPYRG